MRHPGQVSVYLQTDRLVLREFTGDDVEAIVDLDSDPEVMRFLTARPTPLAEVRDVILPFWLAYHERPEGHGFWAAHERSTGDFLGWFHLRPDPDGPRQDGDLELGFRLRRSAWGKGYATEGSRALVHKAFTELEADRVYAHTMSINAGSRRVAEKAGLRCVRTFFVDWPDPIPGDEHGEVEYALTRQE